MLKRTICSLSFLVNFGVILRNLSRLCSNSVSPPVREINSFLSFLFRFSSEISLFNFSSSSLIDPLYSKDEEREREREECETVEKREIDMWWRNIKEKCFLFSGQFNVNKIRTLYLHLFDSFVLCHLVDSFHVIRFWCLCRLIQILSILLQISLLAQSLVTHFLCGLLIVVVWLQFVFQIDLKFVPSSSQSIKQQIMWRKNDWNEHKIGKKKERKGEKSLQKENQQDMSRSFSHWIVLWFPRLLQLPHQRKEVISF